MIMRQVLVVVVIVVVQYHQYENMRYCIRTLTSKSLDLTENSNFSKKSRKSPKNTKCQKETPRRMRKRHK